MVGGFTNFLQIVLLQDKQDVEVPTRVIPNLQNVCQSLSLCTNYTISLCLGYTLFMQYLNIYIYIARRRRKKLNHCTAKQCQHIKYSIVRQNT